MAADDNIKKVTDALTKAGYSADQSRRMIDGMFDSLSRTKDAVTSFADAMESFSRAGLDGNSTLRSTVSAAESLNQTIKNLSGAIGDVPVVGKLARLFVAPFEEVSGAVTNLIGIAEKGTKVFDGMDAGLRDFSAEQFKIAGSIGATFEESKKFGTAYRDIVRSSSDLARDGLYVGIKDVKEITSKLQAFGLSIEDLGQKSEIAGGKFNNAQAMTLQAKAMGMDIATYSERISSMVRKSGLSMEDSMKLMAASQDIARDTGLRVDEVTASLDGASSGFQRMGATMDFGRPILKGFAESVKDVGLGISQAGDLAADFSKTLLGIVNNPALAYVTSMKGGFAGGMGGGGVLNPAIQMQAAMLDQTPGAQAELAKNLSLGIRDTLKSFTNSDIITVKQAAASPELQTKFFSQQQMLSSVYGISDVNTQNRILEMLAKQEEATYSGDEELAAKMDEQIKNALQGNDETKSLQEKISDQLEKTITIAQDQLQVAKLGLVARLKAEGTPVEQFLLGAKNALSQIDDKLLGAGVGARVNVQGLTSEDVKKYTDEQIREIANYTRTATGLPPQVAADSAPVGSTTASTSIPLSQVPTTFNVRLENATGRDISAIPGRVAGGVAQVTVGNK